MKAQVLMLRGKPSEYNARNSEEDEKVATFHIWYWRIYTNFKKYYQSGDGGFSRDRIHTALLLERTLKPLCLWS